MLRIGEDKAEKSTLASLSVTPLGHGTARGTDPTLTAMRKAVTSVEIDIQVDSERLDDTLALLEWFLDRVEARGLIECAHLAVADRSDEAVDAWGKMLTDKLQ